MSDKSATKKNIEIDDKYRELYESANQLMCALGRDGQVDSRHEAVDGVMRALWLLDGCEKYSC